MAEQERIEMPGVLEHILRYCLKEAQERMQNGEEIIPFSAMAAGDTLFCEEHNFDSVEKTFADVRHTVEHARGSQGYGMCYDGFVETPNGNRDALIAQGGVPGEQYGYAIGVLYKVDDEGNLVFDDEPIYIGNCLNYMEGLIELDEEEDEEAWDVEEAIEEVSAEAEAAEQDE